MLALIALLVMWVVTSGDGSGGQGDGKNNGAGPATSIGPGPSVSGPAISEQPGGRDESEGSDGNGSTGSGGSADNGGGTGSGDSAGDGDGGTGDGDSSGTSSAGGGSGSGGGSSNRVPASSGLPDCTSSSVKLAVRSVRNSYEPGEKPGLELVATNKSSVTCKVDLGPKTAVLTITQAADQEEIWASDDCPDGSGRLLFEVPAHGTAKHVVKWDRKFSAAECATPPPGSAKPGTYLVEAQAPGFPRARTTFFLEKD
jgi:hypothetical protein